MCFLSRGTVITASDNYVTLIVSAHHQVAAVLLSLKVWFSVQIPHEERCYGQ